MHFTPTSSSWVNLIERWFKELTDEQLRRGVFTNVPELVEAITTWGDHGNDHPHRSSGTPRPRRSSRKSGEAGSPQPPDQFNDGALESQRLGG
jgi:hypothetical protein